MKLVIYDHNGHLYVPLLERALETRWDIIQRPAEDPSWLEQQLPEADALIALSLDPRHRALACRLKLFLYPGAGYVQDDPEDYPAGCALCSVHEHEVPIAEYIMAAILMHVTRARSVAERFRQGFWECSGRMGGEPHEEAMGKTLGLIGYGAIGQAAAGRARAFGMRVIALRRHPDRPLAAGTPAPDKIYGPGGLRELLGRSDFIVLACPLMAYTRGMLGREQLGWMKPSGVLINIARAELADEEALYEALRERRIAAAALDVWYQYPATRGELLPGSRFPFHELANVLATPHFSAWTGAMLERRMTKMARNLDHLARGEPLERVVLVGAWQSRVTA